MKKSLVAVALLCAAMPVYAAEGIIYSGDYYNGLHAADIYLVRFVSCVALHAVWSGMAAIMLWRFRQWIIDEEGWEWFMWVAVLLSPAIILHGLYDTLLKRDMNAGALAVALVSFAALLAMMHPLLEPPPEDEEVEEDHRSQLYGA